MEVKSRDLKYGAIGQHNRVGQREVQKDRILTASAADPFNSQMYFKQMDSLTGLNKLPTYVRIDFGNLIDGEKECNDVKNEKRYMLMQPEFE